MKEIFFENSWKKYQKNSWNNTMRNFRRIFWSNHKVIRGKIFGLVFSWISGRLSKRTTSKTFIAGWNPGENSRIISGQISRGIYGWILEGICGRIYGQIAEIFGAILAILRGICKEISEIIFRKIPGTIPSRVPRIISWEIWKNHERSKKKNTSNCSKESCWICWMNFKQNL